MLNYFEQNKTDTCSLWKMAYVNIYCYFTAQYKRIKMHFLVAVIVCSGLWTLYNSNPHLQMFLEQIEFYIKMVYTVLIQGPYRSSLVHCRLWSVISSVFLRICVFPNIIKF